MILECIACQHRTDVPAAIAWPDVCPSCRGTAWRHVPTERGATSDQLRRLAVQAEATIARIRHSIRPRTLSMRRGCDSCGEPMSEPFWMLEGDSGRRYVCDNCASLHAPERTAEA